MFALARPSIAGWRISPATPLLAFVVSFMGRLLTDVNRPTAALYAPPQPGAFTKRALPTKTALTPPPCATGRAEDAPRLCAPTWKPPRR